MNNPRMIDFNLNQMIKIKLTKSGKVILERYIDDLYKTFTGSDYSLEMISSFYSIDEDDFISMQVWKAFQIFGKYMNPGTTMGHPLEMKFKLEENAL